MIEALKSKYFNLTSKYTEDLNLIDSFWSQIFKNYTGKNRYYHNLCHIQNMFLHLDNYDQKIKDYDALIFAIWYHDIIYKSTRNDNEEKSALFAQKQLKLIDFDEKRLKNIQSLIFSTKKHQVIVNKNQDNALLLDLDLSILGSNWKTYQNYTQQIRKEYKIYPDFMYVSGRKKVLQHFLERETLYFTEAFKTKFEKQARENLKKELELL